MKYSLIEKGLFYLKICFKTNLERIMIILSTKTENSLQLRIIWIKNENLTLKLSVKTKKSNEKCDYILLRKHKSRLKLRTFAFNKQKLRQDFFFEVRFFPLFLNFWYFK